MSLISIRNVVEPLSNKVHLVTIVVITLTFGIYRASGGTVEVSDRQLDLNRQKTNLFEEAKKTAGSKKRTLVKKKAPAKASSASLDDNNFLHSVLGSNAGSAKNAETAEAKTKVAESSNQNGGGLDDIEKSLGLK